MRWEVAVVQRAVYGVGPLRCKTSRAISQQQGRIVVIGVQGGDVDKTIAVEISRDYPRNDTIPGAHGIRTARRLRKMPGVAYSRIQEHMHCVLGKRVVIGDSEIRIPIAVEVRRGERGKRVVDIAQGVVRRAREA